MSKETDLSDLRKGVNLTITEYSNIPMPSDMTKLQASQLLMREVKMLSDEERRIFDETIQNERFQLDKDHRYWSEKFEEDKFKHEKAKNDSELQLKSEEINISKDRMRLEEEKQNNMLEIEKTKLEIERSRLELDRSNYILNEKSRKSDQIFKYISLGVSVGVPAFVTLVSLICSWKVYKMNLKLIYVDEGRPTKMLENASKSLNDFMKRR